MLCSKDSYLNFFISIDSQQGASLADSAESPAFQVMEPNEPVGKWSFSWIFNVLLTSAIVKKDDI